MSAPALEAFLAQLYGDEQARQRFLADPRSEARAAGLSAEECDALAAIDRVGLELAARSYAQKRSHAAHRGKRRPFGVLARWLR